MEIAFTDDERAIVGLGLRYARSIDTQDQQLFMSCFTRDAIYGLPKLRLSPDVKLDQTLTFLSGLFCATQHVTTNFEVTVTEDRAAMRSYYIATHVWRQKLPDPLFVMGGYYQDALVRTAEGWRICDRLLVNAWVTGDRPAIAAAGLAELLE